MRFEKLEKTRVNVVVVGGLMMGFGPKIELWLWEGDFADFNQSLV
jgi:hypothetical protein